MKNSRWTGPKRRSYITPSRQSMDAKVERMFWQRHGRGWRLVIKELCEYDYCLAFRELRGFRRGAKVLVNHFKDESNVNTLPA